MRHSEPEANTPPMKVHLVQRVQISSRCDQLIKLRTECSMQSMKEGLVLFEPFSERSFEGLQMQPALVQPDEKGQFALLVRNLSTRRLDLENDSLLGTIESVSHTQNAEKENKEHAPSERTATVQLAASRGSSPASERGRRLLDCISWEKCALAPSKIQELKALIVEFENAFAIDDNELGQTHMAVHTIDTGSAKPIKQPLRSCPFALRETVQKLTQQYLRQGVISPSKSPWSSPLVMVKKKDATLRYCVDMREVNAVTKCDAYPVPRISDILHSLNGRTRFTLIDLRSGFWQVPMDPESKEKTAFSTHTGHFEFNVMPFGLVNSGATFERLMETVLAGLQWDFVFLYLDDILIASQDDESHLRHLRMVFERLTMANLRAKPSKCTFGNTETEYLGHIINADGVKVDSAKVAKVANLAAPRNLKKLQAFLGFATYYREFVPNFAKIASPLYALMSKGAKYIWSSDCEQAFNRLRHALTSAPLLAYPDFEGAKSGKRPFLLYTDACRSAVGAVVSQRGVDGKVHVLAYESRKTQAAERNYCVSDLEALAVVHAVKKFRQLLYAYPCTVYTDHAALRSLLTNKQLSGRLARWQLLLREFNLTIAIRPGAKHSNADFLSRLYEEEGDDQKEESKKLGVGEALGTVLLARTAQTEPPAASDEMNRSLDDPPVRPALSQQRDDEFLGPIVTYLESGTIPDDPSAAKRLVVEASQFEIDNGALFFVDQKQKGHMRLALPHSLRQEAVAQEHSGAFGGHLGHERVYYALAQNYYWPGMCGDVKRWIRGCLACATSRDHRRHRPPLTPISANGMFDVLSVDVLEMPLTRDGNKYIISFVDCFSKYCESFATANQTAETIARLLVEHIVCRHGCPSKLLSDRGPAFMSGLLSEVLKCLGVQKLNTSGYHPQGNGLVERMNRTLIKMIKRSASSTVDWDRKLPFIVFAYNSTPAKAHSLPPSFLCYGRLVRRPSSLDFAPKSNEHRVEVDDYRHELVRNLSAANEMASKRIKNAQKQQKRYYDQMQPASKFVVGQRVLVHMPAETTNKLRKLNLPDHGPFYIRELTDNNAEVELATDPTYRLFVALDRVRTCPQEVPQDQTYTGRRKRRPYHRKRTAPTNPGTTLTNTPVTEGPSQAGVDPEVPASLQKEQENQPPTRGRPGLRAHPKRRKTPPGFRRG
uniref:RNA-directed DNA polymerase n=1 Tax=Plectus sambesii TaxID=2011161 RepID=A0A914UKT1_9BILA